MTMQSEEVIVTERINNHSEKLLLSGCLTIQELLTYLRERGANDIDEFSFNGLVRTRVMTTTALLIVYKF